MSDFLALLKAASRSDVVLTVSGGNYNDAVSNSGVGSTHTFSVDTKSPTGQLTLPSGTFTLDQKMTFTLSYDETVAITGGDPFVILKIGDRIRLAEKETHTDANINFSYTVKNSDFDDNGIEITATTGLSRADFTLANTWAVGETITVTHPGGDGNVVYTIESGKTHPEAVATALRAALNADSGFSGSGLVAAGLGSGKISIVGTNAASQTMTKGNASSSGSVNKDSSSTAVIKDLFGNNANSNFSLIGDATNINVNGGQSGVGVDGYLDGVVIYADHDLSGDVSFGDYVTSSDPTGVFQIFGGKSPLIMYSGRDISTGNTFDVQYEAPAGYSVINPISSIIRAIETKDTNNTDSQATLAAENKVSNVLGTSNINFKNFAISNRDNDLINFNLLMNSSYFFIPLDSKSFACASKKPSSFSISNSFSGSLIFSLLIVKIEILSSNSPTDISIFIFII